MSTQCDTVNFSCNGPLIFNNGQSNLLWNNTLVSEKTAMNITSLQMLNPINNFPLNF